MIEEMHTLITYRFEQSSIVHIMPCFTLFWLYSFRRNSKPLKVENKGKDGKNVHKIYQ